MSEEIDVHPRSHHSIVEHSAHSIPPHTRSKSDLDILSTTKSISLQSLSPPRKLSTKMSRSATQLSKTSLEHLEPSQQRASRPSLKQSKGSLPGIAVEKVQSSVHSVIVSQVYVPPPTPVQVTLTPPQQTLTLQALSQTIQDTDPQYNEATDAEEFDAYMLASDHDLRIEQPVEKVVNKRAQTAKPMQQKIEPKRMQSAKSSAPQPSTPPARHAVQTATRKPPTPKPRPQTSHHATKPRPQTSITKKPARPATAPVIPAKKLYTDDHIHNDTLFSLRTQIRSLRKEVSARDTCISENSLREQAYKTKLSNLKATFNDKVAQHSRLYLDRQKRQSIILVSSLKMEVRRLKFERNSLSDPTIEVQYYPYLPRTSFGGGPRNPPVGNLGNCASKAVDYFVMNPPPASGTHEDGGNVHWWGKNETAPLTNRSMESKRHTSNIQLGSRVSVLVDEKRYNGTVKYLGVFDGSPLSGDWCGVRLDAPVGRHDGVVHGRRYFSCEDNHGFFAKMGRITLV